MFQSIGPLPESISASLALLKHFEPMKGEFVFVAPSGLNECGNSRCWSIFVAFKLRKQNITHLGWLVRITVCLRSSTDTAFFCAGEPHSINTTESVCSLIVCITKSVNSSHPSFA